jgi:hypothetical protein
MPGADSQKFDDRVLGTGGNEAGDGASSREALAMIGALESVGPVGLRFPAAASDKHKIRTLFVVFDDCWDQHPKVGKQREPVAGVHNSGWVQSPSSAVVRNPREWPRLEGYVKDLVGTFGKDARVLAWDLYNEPDNGHLGDQSLPLLEATFRWARAADPSQARLQEVARQTEVYRYSISST